MTAMTTPTAPGRAEGLMACPWCRKVTSCEATCDDESWWVWCFDCHCRGPKFTSKYGAEMAWNRRPAPGRAEGLLPCPFCGGEARMVQIGSSRWSCQVECTNCNTHHESPDEGAKSGTSWNHRYSAVNCSTCNNTGYITQDGGEEHGPHHTSCPDCQCVCDEAYAGCKLHPVSRPAPAIVAEVGEITHLLADIDAAMRTGYIRPMLWTECMAALRTLAEVRGELAQRIGGAVPVSEWEQMKAERDELRQEVARLGAKVSALDSSLGAALTERDVATQQLAEVRDTLESAGVMLADSNSRLRAQLSAATRRAEQAEAGLTTIGDLICTECVPCQRIREVISAALPAPATSATGSSHNQS